METNATLAADVAWLAVWLGASFLSGVACCSVMSARATLRGGLWPNPELAAFFALCAGLALQVLVLIALALVGLLRPVPILLAFVGLAACSLVYLVRIRTAWEDFAACFRLPGAEWLKVVPIVLLILPWVLRPLGPAGGSDSLAYHLPYARFYLEQGGLAVDETLRFPLHTHNINLLYSVAMIRPGATLAQLLHAAMGWLAMLGVYGMARHWRGWPAAVLAAGGMLLLGEFIYSFSAAFVDNGAMVFVTAAFLALVLWSEGGARGLVWCAALFAGTAMGTKYLGAMFTVPLGLLVLWHSRSLGLTIRFALAVAVVGLFWYLRSWWISGNPVHPFAGNVFGYWLWTPDELVGQMLELGGHGVAKTWQNFLLLPERLFSERASFNGSTTFGGLLIGAFMLGCLLLPWQRPAVRWLQLSVFAWLAFWFSSAQVIRYLMLAIPLMSLSAAMAWSGLFMRLLSRRDPDSGAPVARLVAFNSIALVFVLSGLIAFAVRWLAIDLQRVPLTAEAREAFVLRTQPSYSVALAAEADPRIGKGPVLQFRLPEFRYFFRGKVYGDWMGPHSFSRYGHVGPSNYWEINDSATLYRQVVGTDIRAVVMNKVPDHQFRPQEIASYRAHFEIIEETEGAVLMIPLPVETSPGPVQ
ncbi:MAG TPA: hypothetical protein VMN03_02950 [Burkholderiales bacterium]|nr:hypothetical protein [Burkholderiales bacterium]